MTPGRPVTGGRAVDSLGWSWTVAELVYERSAVMRLGARVVGGEDELPVPVTRRAADYVPPAPGQQQPARTEVVSTRHELDANKYELAVVVRLPNPLFEEVLEDPGAALAVQEDIAESLALRADRAFLHGDGNVEPCGVSDGVRVGAGVLRIPQNADALGRAREMVDQLRRTGTPFRCPGWVLHPRTVDRLTRLLTVDGLSEAPKGTGRSLDTFPLMRLDGADGGALLELPFVSSEAAQVGGTKRMFLSADWSEAWIGVDRELATVDVSAEAAFATDETLIRAVMRHDFTLRRPDAFAFTNRPAAG